MLRKMFLVCLLVMGVILNSYTQTYETSTDVLRSLYNIISTQSNLLKEQDDDYILLRRQLTNLTEQYETLENRVTTLDDLQKSLDGQATTFEKQQNQLEEQVNDLSNDFDDIDNSMKRQENSLNQALTGVNNVESELTKYIRQQTIEKWIERGIWVGLLIVILLK